MILGQVSFRQDRRTRNVVTGIFFGIILGLIFRAKPVPWSPREAMYISFVGEIFLQMLQCMIIPLVVPSITSSVASIGTMEVGFKVLRRIVLYYVLTTAWAVFLGLLMVMYIKPGSSISVEEGRTITNHTIRRYDEHDDTLMGFATNIFPPNLLQATVETYSTVVDESAVVPPDAGEERDAQSWLLHGVWRREPNLHGLIVASVAMGIGLVSVAVQLPESTAHHLRVLDSLTVVMMQITSWIIQLIPFGVCSLLMGHLIQLESLEETMRKLGLYMITVSLGIAVHGGIILPAVYAVFTRRWPFRFLSGMSRALFTAFGTASSSATLPVTMECLEQNNGVDPRISKLVLPVGATLNMDGTALYEAVTTVFIAQIHKIPLDMSDVLVISVKTAVTSMAAAGMPHADLIMMNLPPKDAALIFTVDWLLDRFRTPVNVLGDAIGAGIVHHISKDEMTKIARTCQDGNCSRREDVECTRM